MAAKRAKLPTTAQHNSEIMSWMLKAKSVPKGKIKLLLESAELIRVAWEGDGRGGKGFPLNTTYAFWELEDQLRGSRSHRIRFIPYRKPPTRLSDILPEKVVRQVHEYLYEEPMDDALDELSSPETIHGALARIKNTVETALYVQQFGEQALPAPRGNWLHRQMLGLIRAAIPQKITDSETAKLFDYLCPCGGAHNRETIKKFRWRHSVRDK
jgi:hypothetical protein